VARTHGERQETESAPKIRYGELNSRLGYFLRRAQYWAFKDVNSRIAHLRIDVVRYSILEVASANPGLSQKLLAIRVYRAAPLSLCSSVIFVQTR